MDRNVDSWGWIVMRHCFGETLKIKNQSQTKVWIPPDTKTQWVLLGLLTGPETTQRLLHHQSSLQHGWQLMKAGNLDLWLADLPTVWRVSPPDSLVGLCCLFRAAGLGLSWAALFVWESLSAAFVITAYCCGERRGLMNSVSFRDFLKLMAWLFPKFWEASLQDRTLHLLLEHSVSSLQ